MSQEIEITRALKARDSMTWYVQKAYTGCWAVVVEAPGTSSGGWCFHCTDEHSARLACDALNYLAGKPTPYTDEKMR